MLLGKIGRKIDSPTGISLHGDIHFLDLHLRLYGMLKVLARLRARI